MDWTWLINIILAPLLQAINIFFGFVTTILKDISNFFHDLLLKGDFGILTPLVIALFIIALLILVMILPKVFYRILDLVPFIG